MAKFYTLRNVSKFAASDKVFVVGKAYPESEVKPHLNAKGSFGEPLWAEVPVKKSVTPIKSKPKTKPTPVANDTVQPVKNVEFEAPSAA